MHVELSKDETEQIIYCMGIARGLLWRDITREVDEEVRNLLKEHLTELDHKIEAIMEKFANAAVA